MTPLTVDDNNLSTVWEEFNNTPDDARREELRQPLRDYALAKKKREDSDREEQLSSMFLNFDAWWSQNDDGRPWDADAKAAVANRQFIAARMGKTAEDIVNGFPTYRDLYAREHFGKPKVTNTKFFDLVKGQYETMNQREAAVRQLHIATVSQALRDTLEGKETPLAPVFQQWAEANRELIGGEGDSRFLTGAFGSYRQARSDIQKFKGPAAKVWDSLTKFSKGEEDVDDLISLGRELAGLPLEDRKTIYGYASLAAEGDMIDPGAISQIGDNLLKSVARSFGVGLSRVEENALLMLQSAEEGGFLIREEDGKPVMKAGTIYEGKPGYREATPEERQAFIDQARELLPVIQIARELKDVANNQIDPVRPVFEGEGFFSPGTIERGVYGLAGSTGTMAMTAIPAFGPFVAAMAYSDSEYERMRLDYPDLDQGAARRIATVSGAAQAAIDKIQLEGLAGRLPGLGRLMRDAKPGLTKWLASTAVTAGAENVLEGAQDLVPVFVDQIASAIHEDMPAKDLRKELGEWANQRAETFWAVLPLALIGGGIANFRDFKDGGRFAVEKPWLDVAGFSEAQQKRIQAAKTPEEAETIYREEFQKREQKNIEAGLGKLQELLGEAENAQNDSASPTLQVGSVNGATTWTVYDPEGNVEFQTQDKQAAEEAYAEASRRIVEDALFRQQEEANGEQALAEEAEQEALSGILESKEPSGWGSIESDKTPDASGADALTKLPEPDTSDLDVSSAEPVIGPASERAISIANGSIRDWKARPVEASELHSAHSSGGAALARAVAAIFGRRVVVFETDTKFPPANGFVNTDRRNRNFIFLHNRGDRPHLSVIGHELYHQIEITAPTLAKELQAALAPLVKVDKVDAAKADYDPSRRAHEAVGDLFGDAITKDEFWDRLHAQNPSAFTKIARAVKQWLTKIVDILKRRGLDGSPYFTDIERARELATSALLKFAQNPKGDSRLDPTGPYDPNENLYSARDAEIEAFIEALRKNPDERLRVYEAVKDRLTSMIAQNRRDLDLLSIPIDKVDAKKVEPAATNDGEAALARLEEDRAARLADLNIEEQAEIEQMSMDNLDNFAPRIEEAKSDATKKALEREARARAVERRKGIAAKYREKRKALEAEIKAEAEKIKIQVANAKAEAKAKAGRKNAVAAQKATADHRVIEERRKGELRRQKLIRAIGELNALLRVFPPEIRGKVGGFATLANIGTGDKALHDFMVKRIEMVGAELERSLRKEYDARLQKLFKRARPAKDQSGKKRVGKAGAELHALFDTLRDAISWDAEKAEVHVGALETQLAKGEMTPEQEAHAQIEIGLVPLFADWKNADAERRAAAVKNAEEVWDKGYRAFVTKKLEQREQRAARRDQLISDTGKAGTPEERDARALKDNGLLGRWKSVPFGLLNFEQSAKWVFGDASIEAERLSDMEREASHTKEDVIGAKMRDIDDLFTEIAGGRYKGEQLRHRLAQKTMKAGKRQLSELEAITATLMWRQEAGRNHMIGQLDENGKPVSKWHYDQTFIDEIESQLSPEAKIVRQFLSTQYAGEYATLNPIYREVNGIDLPKNPEYSPLTVVPMQAQAGQVVDPVTGSTFSAASTTPGSLRNRSGRIAEPDFRDALQTYIAHTKQIEHWKAYAQFVNEAQAILGNRDVGNSVKAAAGTEAEQVLRNWIDFFAQGGTRDAAAHLAINQAFSRMSSRAASVALVGRIGTLAIQSTQLAAASAQMPAGAYMVRLGKLFAGQLGWGDAFSSPYIQRRLNEMPPIVRQAVDGFKAEKPSRLRHAVARMGQLIGGADALFTSGTYAIIHDYQLAQAREMGLSGESAQTHALQATERIVDRIAQPTRPGARSLYENTATHPLARVAWAFASDARKNLGLLAYAVAKRPLADKLRAASYVILLNSAIAAVIRAAWADARDGEDDEWFDEKHWNPKRLALSMTTEWMYGVPVFGEMAQQAIFKAAGEWLPEGNLFSSAGRSIPAIMRIPETLAGEQEADEIMRDVDAILSGMGLFNANIAAAASISHLARDLFGVTENVVGDE